jgi:hypothetical protein
VEYGEDNDAVRLQTIIHRVWEAGYRCFTDVTMDDRISLRLLRQQLQHLVNLGDEIVA